MVVHTKAGGFKKARNKMDAARLVLRGNPGISAKELKQALESEFGMKMTPKMAYNYKFKISQEFGHGLNGNGSAAHASVRPAVDGSAAGLDDLIRAARSLGWSRIKAIAEGILLALSSQETTKPPATICRGRLRECLRPGLLDRLFQKACPEVRRPAQMLRDGECHQRPMYPLGGSAVPYRG